MKNKKKIKVAVLFGGKSAEHEISQRSAKSIIDALDKDKYEITPILINKTGRWEENNLGSNIFEDFKKFDVVFPILHGPFGEDGTVQGLLKIVGVPFVGAGVTGSAVGMDKDVMKRLLRDAKISIANFLVFKKNELKNINFNKVKKTLGLPFFIKPANLGSSVGISKVYNQNEFDKAIVLAFDYDNKILIEEYIKGRELECSVLGNESPKASTVGEIISAHDFYSYDAKYLDENGTVLKIPAELPKIIEEKIKKVVVKAFEVLCCEGMARVDLFLTKKNKIVLNEINTIPGFTSISMYPKLWEQSGVSYSKLVDTLIELAIDRFDKESKLKTSFEK